MLSPQNPISSTLIFEAKETEMSQKRQNSNKKQKIKVISLFSGCGGMDLGFTGGFEFLGKKYTKNPFDIIWANDFNEAACRTYAKNIGSHIHHGDIWEMINANKIATAEIIPVYEVK